SEARLFFRWTEGFRAICCLRSPAVRGGGLAIFYSVTFIRARWRRAHFSLVLSWGSSRPRSDRRRGLARTAGCRRCPGPLRACVSRTSRRRIDDDAVEIDIHISSDDGLARQHF